MVATGVKLVLAAALMLQAMYLWEMRAALAASALAAPAWPPTCPMTGLAVTTLCFATDVAAELISGAVLSVRSPPASSHQCWHSFRRWQALLASCMAPPADTAQQEVLLVATLKAGLDPCLMLQGEHAQLRDEHETAVEQLHMASASTRHLQVRPAAAAGLWPPGKDCCPACMALPHACALQVGLPQCTFQDGSGSTLCGSQEPRTGLRL